MSEIPGNPLDRKKDHIDLAFSAQTGIELNDERFYYEPMMSAHPKDDELLSCKFGNKTLSFPIWISSMTGGTSMAKKINQQLARACNEFGLGFGLGSCRKLISNPEFLTDYDVRSIIGNHLPLYANLGIAQIEQWLHDGKISQVQHIIDLLQADGLIVHINPMQEYVQAEGDRIQYPPIETLKKLLDNTQLPIIVKEVGQGIGPASLKALLELPLQAIEFAAFGGTNFAVLEMQRNNSVQEPELYPISNIGHTANEMLEYCNAIVDITTVRCNQLIISGGIRNFLDGYYFIQKSKIPAIYGQASSFLKYAMEDYETLRQYIQSQVRGLKLAYSYLKIKG